MNIPTILITTLSLLISCTAFADKISSSPLSFGSVINLPSTYLNEKQNIHVYLPQGYQQAADHIRYPVIYTLDGWALSQTVSGVVNHLGNTASMPKAIVVAINSENEFEYGPKLYTSKSGWGEDPAVELDGFSGGQADLYLNFLQQELIPYIDNKYRTNHFRILIGMSPTATFALHTFWKSPKLFDAHFLFAATDVLGMGYSPETTFVDKIVESLAKDPERKGYLYIASAQREAIKNPIRLDNIQALETALAPYTKKNFALKAEHIDNFGHYPMAIPGLLSAIDLVFPRSEWGMSGRYNEMVRQKSNPLEQLDNYYQKLSESVGFTVTPNTDLRRNSACLRSMAYRLRNNKRYKESEQIYQRWIKDAPKTAKPYAGLAETYIANGQLAMALSYSKKSVVLAEVNQSPFLSDFKKELKMIEEKIAANTTASN
ncbi:MAG: alpha/beta hydrolase-fold protein [Colwellia sp.]|nr:alpha/beta hydrolase-fold protein [Colwellia sp.]